MLRSRGNRNGDGKPSRLPVVLTLLLAGLLAAALVETGGGLGAVRAAEAQPSYELTDIQLEYPYRDPRDATLDPTRAGVSYVSSWAGASYPGLADCNITLHGADGTEVGRYSFGLSSGTPTDPPLPFQPVDVNAPPSSAEGACQPTVYPTGSGYTFDNPSVSRPTDPQSGRPETGKTRLAFRARWATTTPPGLRKCTVHVRNDDGSSTAYGPLAVQLPDGGEFVIEPPIANPQSIRDAEVRCSELD